MSDERILESDRVALLYDVHGNDLALEAVLEDLAERGIGDVVFGGDYANAGPRPHAAVRRVRQIGRAAIRGNTDEWVTGESDPPESEPFEWTRDHLTSDQLEWLRDLPFDCRVRPEDGADGEEDDLLVVHANPSDLLTPMILEEHPFEDWSLSDEEEIEELVSEVTADLVVFGHIHHASRGEVGGRRLRSVGSVGLPWDGDQRAAYAVAEWTGESWELEDVRVEYDWESVAEELDRSGAPGAEETAESIRTASFEPMS